MGKHTDAEAKTNKRSKFFKVGSIKCIDAFAVLVLQFQDRAGG